MENINELENMALASQTFNNSLRIILILQDYILSLDN